MGKGGMTSKLEAAADGERKPERAPVMAVANGRDANVSAAEAGKKSARYSRPSAKKRSSRSRWLNAAAPTGHRSRPGADKALEERNRSQLPAGIVAWKEIRVRRVIDIIGPDGAMISQRPEQHTAAEFDRSAGERRQLTCRTLSATPGTMRRAPQQPRLVPRSGTPPRATSAKPSPSEHERRSSQSDDPAAPAQLLPSPRRTTSRVSSTRAATYAPHPPRPLGKPAAVSRLEPLGGRVWACNITTGRPSQRLAGCRRPVAPGKGVERDVNGV